MKHWSFILPLTLLAYAANAQQDTSRTPKPKGRPRNLQEVVISAGSFDASDKAKGASLTPIDAVTVAGSNGDISQSLRSLPGAQQIGEREGLFVRGGTGDETQQFIDGTLLRNPNYPSVPGLPQFARINPFLFRGILFNTGGYSALYGQAMSSALILESVDLPEESSASFSVFPSNIGTGFQRLSKNKKSSYGAGLNYNNYALYNSIVPQKPDFFSGPRYLGGDANFRIKTGKTGMLKFYTNWNASNVGMNNPDIDSTSLVSAFQTKGKHIYNNISYKDYLDDNWKIDVGAAYSYNQVNTVTGLKDSAGNKVELPDAPFGDKNSHTLINSHFAQARVLLTRSFRHNQALRLGAEHFYFQDKGISFSEPVSLTDHLTAAFAEGDIYLAPNLAAKTGVRLEHSSLLGKWAIAPRISLAYRFNNGGQFNFAYGVFYQKPLNDVLYQNKALDFSHATHYVLNYTRKVSNRFFRAEAYYKLYRDLVKTVPDVSNTGKGYARGLELFFRDKKSIKNLDYWVTYTYLDTKRDFMDYPYELRPSFAAPHTATIAVKKFFADISTYVNVSYSFAAGRPYYDFRYDDVSDQGTTKPYSVMNLHVAYLTSFFPKRKQKDYSGIAFGVNNLLGTKQVFGYNYSVNGMHKVPVTLPAARGYFIGVFVSLGTDRTDDFLDNNL